MQGPSQCRISLGISAGDLCYCLLRLVPRRARRRLQHLKSRFCLTRPRIYPFLVS
jgi:hypothetical protein